MKDRLKEIISKIVHGFLFGIGLVLAFSASAYAIGKIFNETSDKSVFITSGSKYGDENENTDESKDVIEILSHSDKSSGNRLMIVGKVHNTGKTSWNYVNLQVEFFENDEFVFECDEYLDELSPDSEENFMVACGGCDEFALPKYDKYTIRVVSANEK